MIKKAFMEVMNEEKDLNLDGKYAKSAQCKVLKMGFYLTVVAACANNSHFI